MYGWPGWVYWPSAGYCRGVNQKTENQSFQSMVTAWKKLIDQCYASIHSGFRPRLLHHQGVGSAFVAGMIRPVVIFPTAWVNRLSAEEAECVLLHELAHLNARDHMMNLVCAISEILLFFNPGESFLLLAESEFQREICADESVIRKDTKPVSYARLLVNLVNQPCLHQRWHLAPYPDNWPYV